MLTRASSGREFGVERCELVSEVSRPAQRGTMTAVDLVGRDAESLLRNAAQERRREESVGAAQEHARPHLRPCVERPGLVHAGFRLAASPAQRLDRELARDVLVEEVDRVVVVLSLLTLVAGAGPVRGG